MVDYHCVDADILKMVCADGVSSVQNHQLRELYANILNELTLRAALRKNPDWGHAHWVLKLLRGAYAYHGYSYDAMHAMYVGYAPDTRAYVDSCISLLGSRFCQLNYKQKYMTELMETLITSCEYDEPRTQLNQLMDMHMKQFQQFMSKRTAIK